MADDHAYCERLVRDGDRDRFIATLFAPASRRPALFALYAFDVELARVRQVAREPMPGEIRLQWWREVIGGQRTGEAGAVAAALLATIDRCQLPVADLLAMIEARSFDLYDDPMGSLAELEGYADKTSGAIIRLAAHILSDGDAAAAHSAAGHAGIAHAIALLMAALPLHRARRQLYLPLDLMQKHGARPEVMDAPAATSELKAVLAELREIARTHLRQIAAADIAPAVRPAFLASALTRPLLDRLARDLDPLAPRPLPAWRRQWLIWRAARDPRRLA